MPPLRNAKPTLRVAVAECREACRVFGEAAQAAYLLQADHARIVKFLKRLQPLFDDLDGAVVQPDAEAKGVQAVKAITGALQRSTLHAHTCSSIGPLQALLQAAPLAQESCNCVLDLHSALQQVDAPSLMVGEDLLEELEQLCRQLGRLATYAYPQQQVDTVTQLHLLAEQVRQGAPSAPQKLAGLLREAVLGGATPQQAAADLDYLQQALEQQEAGRNHVGAACYSSLLGAVQSITSGAVNNAPGGRGTPGPNQQQQQQFGRGGSTAAAAPAPAAPTATAAEILAAFVSPQVSEAARVAAGVALYSSLQALQPQEAQGGGPGGYGATRGDDHDGSYSPPRGQFSQLGVGPRQPSYAPQQQQQQQQQQPGRGRQQQQQQEVVAPVASGPAAWVQQLVEVAGGEVLDTKLPVVDGEELLQALCEPLVLKGVVTLVSPEGPAATPAKVPPPRVRLLAVALLQAACATDPGLLGVLASAAPASAALARCATGQGTSEELRCALLRLLAGWCGGSMLAGRRGADEDADEAAAGGYGASQAGAAAAAVVRQMVEEGKVVPGLVQLLGNVRIVKGKAIAGPATCVAVADTDSRSQRPGSGYSPVKGGGAQRGLHSGSSMAPRGAAGINMGRGYGAGGSAASGEGGPAAGGDRPAGVTLLVLELLLGLAPSHVASVVAAGGLPVLAQVLGQQQDAGVQRGAIALLEALVAAGGAALAAQALEAELLPALACICCSAPDPATASAGLQAVATLLAPTGSPADAAGGRDPRGSVDAWVSSQQQQQQRGNGFQQQQQQQQQQKPGGRQRQWQEEEGEEEEEGGYMQQQQRQQERAGRRGPGGPGWQQEVEQAAPGTAGRRGSPAKAPQRSSGAVGAEAGGGEVGAAAVAALGRSCSAASVAAGMELLALAVSNQQQLQGATTCILPLLQLLAAACTRSEQRQAAAGSHQGMACCWSLATTEPSCGVGEDGSGCGYNNQGAVNLQQQQQGQFGGVGPGQGMGYAPNRAGPAGYNSGLQQQPYQQQQQQPYQQPYHQQQQQVADGGDSRVAAAAVALLVAVAGDKELKVALAAPLSEALLRGAPAARIAAAGIAARLARPPGTPAPGATVTAPASMGGSMAGGATAAAAAGGGGGGGAAAGAGSAGVEAFCQQLLVCHGLEVLVDMLHAPDPGLKAAGVEAVHAVAVGGGTRCAAALLSSAAAPDLVDVVRLHPADTPLAAAAMGALAALAAAPGGTAAAVDPLVAFLQPSSAAAAGRAASALLVLTEASPAAAAAVAASTALPSLVALLRQPLPPTTQVPCIQLASLLLRSPPPPPVAASMAAAAGQPGVVGVLLTLLRMREEGVRLPAAGALGHLARRSAPDRDAIVAGRGVSDLMEALKSGWPEDWGWDAAVSAVATLGVFHDAGRAELVKVLRTQLLRSGPREAGAAAQVVSRLASSAKGREAVLQEGLVPGLVGVVSSNNCSPEARAAAAAAISALSVPMAGGGGGGEGGARGGGQNAGFDREAAAGRRGGMPATAGGGMVGDPRIEIVRSGAVAPLVALVRTGLTEACIVEACEALYCLAGCPMGADAVASAGGREVLQDVVLRGRRKEVGEKAGKAAYEALMRVL